MKSARQRSNSVDIDQAKTKAALIREQGLKKYQEQLLGELEQDKKRKLCVVTLLYLASLAVILLHYYWNTDLGALETKVINYMIDGYIFVFGDPFAEDNLAQNNNPAPAN